MVHIDLFSGIGGFALAVDEVFGKSEHIFCEIDKYCQSLLKKRFEGSVIYGDIRTLSRERLIADTNSRGQAEQELQTAGNKQCDRWATPHSQSGQSGVEETRNRWQDISRGSEEVFILTGGFPCQPFSQAGKRKGTSDNRYLWPEMLRVIRDFKPTWVIAENVRGILTIEGGMVFEQVCLDLEGEGYEVQPFIIPAVAVNAPHRRDRVWFIANRTGKRPDTGKCDRQERQVLPDINRNASQNKSEWSGRKCGSGEISEDAPDTESGGREQFYSTHMENSTGGFERGCENWEESWVKVATELCGVDDGLPAELDGLKLSKSRHRVERLKALGNAIVPQVAVEIMKAIKYSSE